MWPVGVAVYVHVTVFGGGVAVIVTVALPPTAGVETEVAVTTPLVAPLAGVNTPPDVTVPPVVVQVTAWLAPEGTTTAAHADVALEAIVEGVQVTVTPVAGGGGVPPNCTCQKATPAEHTGEGPPTTVTLAPSTGLGCGLIGAPAAPPAAVQPLARTGPALEFTMTTWPITRVPVRASAPSHPVAPVGGGGVAPVPLK